MTRIACLVLDPTSVTVRLPGVAARTLPWSPAEPSALRALVPTLTRDVTAVRVVVGLGLLDYACPELPPASATARRAIVWLDPARYLANDAPMAVTCLDAWVIGLPAAQLIAWRQALAGAGPVTFISAAAVAAQRGGSTRVVLPAGDRERAELVLRDGHLQSLQRIPDDATRSTGTGAVSSTGAIVAVDSAALAEAALAWVRPGVDTLLLDRAEALAQTTATQRRRWRLAALAVVALVLAALGAEQLHMASVARAIAVARQRAQAARPAQQAYDRLMGARSEAAVLTADVAAQTRRDEVLTVLAALTRRLPADVVVQRLEWDGTHWRLEGTADRAPQLIPMLDADPAFRGIRMAAPSQRFLDAGRQRESFAFAWPGERTPPGGTRAR